MQGQHHQSQHGCCGESRGPEVYYGYCHESGRMRMMDYSDYMSNMQTGYSNLYKNPASVMQPMINMISSMMQAPAGAAPAHGARHGHDCGCQERDCSCTCCIRCADLVEYARCGEVRRIPITFDNDTRRERDVTLQLGNFATESGQETGWQTDLSTTQFTLPPCGETTVVLSVNVDCGKIGTPGNQQADQRQPGTVDGCKVAYATLRAEGCTIRPLVIAVAVLPEHCGAHRTGCGCGCCGCN